MKRNARLRFIIIVAIGLCAAVAFRAFAANKHRDSGLFTLEIKKRVTLKNGGNWNADKTEGFLKDNHALSYHICFRQGPDGVDDHRPKVDPSPATCTDSARPTQPHVQQTVHFNSLADLRAVVDALAKNSVASTPAPSTPKPPPSSPAPQVQQHVESTTPQAAKAITVALSH